MAEKNILIITDEQGEIIAAQVQDAGAGKAVGRIRPTGDNHRLHEVRDVPAAIHAAKHPDEFHRFLTDHVKSNGAKVHSISVEDLRAAAFEKSS